MSFTNIQLLQLREELKNHFGALAVLPMFGRQDIFKLVKSRTESYSLYLTTFEENNNSLQSCEMWLNRMVDLSHPHILRIYRDDCYECKSVTSTSSPYCVVKCEIFLENSNLFSIKDKRFSEAALIELIFQVGSALLYMETNFKFIHGSINLDSIYLRSFDEDQGEITKVDSILGFLNNLKSEQSALKEINNPQSLLKNYLSHAHDIYHFGECLKKLMSKKQFHNYSMQLQEFVYKLSEAPVRPVSWKVLFDLVPGRCFSASGSMNSPSFSFEKGDILKVISIHEVDSFEFAKVERNGKTSLISFDFINLSKPLVNEMAYEHY